MTINRPTSALEWAQTRFEAFRAEIDTAIAAGTLADDIIGKNLEIDGPFGPVRLLYADYAASGRALRQVERFMAEEVLPVYANPHTQASYCGRSINALRKIARQEIARFCGADDRHAVIFAGSGATAGLHKLVHLLGADASGGPQPLVLLGPYEHHSNLLPWRESGAEVIELPEGPDGGPDRDVLEARLQRAAGRRVICSFSAGSNVTGMLTDIAATTRMVKSYGARMVWDYAGAAPYRPMVMEPAPGAEIDALVFSPHKLVGGPASSGVLVMRRDCVTIDKPSAPGGGTVSFVSGERQDYHGDLVAREEAGTPNSLADIRAALAMIVRDCMAIAEFDRHAQTMRETALTSWRANDRIEILGECRDTQLPIVSFRIRGPDGQLVHHQLITRILSDAYGIQARGGCACAGPYVHQLLQIDSEHSQSIRHAINEGRELAKPGFVRLNFSSLMSSEDLVRLVGSVNCMAANIADYARHYTGNDATAVFEPVVPERLAGDAALA